MDSLILKTFPGNVQIDVNNFCNLNCPVCANAARRGQAVPAPKLNMSLDNFESIASKLNFPSTFTFGNKNEPMLNPDVFKMISHLHKVNPNAHS